MSLNSTVVTINNLLKLNFPNDFQAFLETPKTYFSIPDYQREYKWDETKIKTFVSNVMTQSKFLGIITTEVPSFPYLSIVDGQQRLTTMMLLMAWLYNACADEGETETQQEIENLITYTSEGCLKFILENASVGEYLHLETDANGIKRIKLEINSQTDIFRQSSQFVNAWNIIGQTAADTRAKNPTTTLDGYKQKLLDCKMLIFAQKNTDGVQQGSIEEIYIDINEKSQKLDHEDIFKGHCFAICKTMTTQAQVKELWRTIKQQFFSMDEILKKTDMDSFLHYYLLTQEATKETRKDIKKDLTIDGESVITRDFNSPTKVKNLLEDIELYQANILEFNSGLNCAQPEFANIMTASAQEIGNNRTQLFEIQKIIKELFACQQNLFKLPVFYFIDKHMRKPAGEKLTYAQLSGFIYLYYIYMFLFARLVSSRKRADLANGLIKNIHSGEGFLLQFIKEIKDYSDSLAWTLEEKGLKSEARKHLYQLLDYFQATSTASPATSDSDLTIKMRLFPDAYNMEHLIVHKSHKITWRSANYTEHNTPENTEYKFTINDFRTCQPWIKPNNQWANFIWIDGAFNRDTLQNYDIITKIKSLRGDCVKDNPPANGTYAKKHAHIELICQHIMQTAGFDQLYEAYQTNAARDVVRDRYQVFIDNYFAEDSTKALCQKLNEKFSAQLGLLYELVQ